MMAFGSDDDGDATSGPVTGQVQLDSYADAGVFAATGLVNELALAGAGDLSTDATLAAIARILAVDPPSVARLRRSDVAGFTALAHRLHEVFGSLRDGDIDAAATRLNELLAEHPAPPYLAVEHGRWRLHHHPVDARLVPMWTSICAEGVARLITSDDAHRLGTCEDPGCGRVFVDVTRNASRRFCSTTCQNRVKAAAFRRRRAPRARDS